MHIQHLACFNFRNLGKLDLELRSRTVVVRGNNGQGKTNLLEALYFCATGRSFRGSTSREMLRLGQERGWCRALFERHGVRHEIEARLSARRRTIRVDDRNLRRTSSLLELVNVVAFFPEDLRIAKGAPEERRRFLDRAIANRSPDFVDASLAYSKVLRSRNALLRQDSPPNADVLSAFDAQLVEHGTVIHHNRVAGLAAMRPLAERRFAEIMDIPQRFSLSLEAGLPTPSDDFAGDFAQALRQSFGRDRARGLTHVGPHRADLCLQLGEQSARAFASQGQQRAMVLALKLAEVESLTEQIGTAPILLLDDVSSELDSLRTELLFRALVATDCHIWVSTTGSVDLPLPADALILDLKDGRIDSIHS